MLKHPFRGISAPDARALAYVFLKELAENVVDHSGVSSGLMAAWARPATAAVRKDECLPEERDFYRRVSESTVVELILGDSGSGVWNVLAPAFREYGRSLVDTGDEEETLPHLSETEQVLFWAFDKWSSSALQGRKRGTRGLYRVQRIASKWRGSVSLRSGNHNVGFSFVGPGERSWFHHSGTLPGIPGTAVHVRLPVGEDVKGRMIPWTPVSGARFQVIPLPRSVTTVSAVADFAEKLAAFLRAGSSITSSLDIVIDAGFAPLDRHVLEALLEELVQLAHPAAVVLANVGAPYWDAVEETINSLDAQLSRPGAELQDPTRVSNAVLVADGSGHTQWAGVGAQVREALGHLLSSGPLSSGDLAALLRRTDSTPRETARTLELLSDQNHVLKSLPGGHLALRFTLGDVIEALRAELGTMLQSLVESAPEPAVMRSGPYLTPSLRLLPSFIRLDLLLTGDQRERAFELLSLLIRQRLRVPTDVASTFLIVSDEGKGRGLAEELRKHLVEASVHTIPAYSRPHTRHTAARIDTSSAVIVFTDILSTGFLARRLLSHLAKSGIHPALIACVFDAREAHDQQFSWNGVEIPVVSLSRYHLKSVEVEDPETCVAIDPLTTLPEVSAAPITHSYPVSPEELDSILEDSRAVYFDHIVRQDWRHFTFYLDLLQLFRPGDGAYPSRPTGPGERLLNAAREEARHWLSNAREKGIDAIWYPEEEDPRGPTYTVARWLASELGLEADGVGALQRRPGPGYFLLATASADLNPKDRNPPTNVVLIDWGSMTGSTVRQMIAWATTQGVKRALVLVVLSQIAPQEEEFLRQLGTLGGTPTEVSIRFLSAWHVLSYQDNNCPYCLQLQRFDDELRLDPPELLHSYIDEARKQLAGKSLADARSAAYEELVDRHEEYDG